MDLAQGIVWLTEAARDRRIGHNKLAKATSAVAASIAEQLRDGDKVTITVPKGASDTAGIDFVNYQAMRVTWPVSQWANGEGAFMHPEGEIVLVRDTGVFEDARDSYCDGSNIHEVVEGGGVFPFGATDYSAYGVENDVENSLHFASPAERIAFAREALQAVVGFRQKLDQQARTFSEAAQRISKVAVR